MATTVRAGRREDAALLAWVTLAASRAHLRRGVWDLIIGADEAGCLEYLRRLVVSEPKSLCHYESFLVAEVDGQAVAAACGFEIRASGWTPVGQAMENVQTQLGWSEAEADASRRRLAPVWNCFLRDASADWGIENVATFPEFRRRGLAGALVNQLVLEGNKRGCRRAQIVSFLGNDEAVAVYRRCGFSIGEEQRHHGLKGALGAEGLVRLVRDI
jgi:ribosomal protein S18 acetylase RimI-like enzyme